VRLGHQRPSCNAYAHTTVCIGNKNTATLCGLVINARPLPGHAIRRRVCQTPAYLHVRKLSRGRFARQLHHRAGNRNILVASAAHLTWWAARIRCVYRYATIGAHCTRAVNGSRWAVRTGSAVVWGVHLYCWRSVLPPPTRHTLLRRNNACTFLTYALFVHILLIYNYNYYTNI